MEETDGLDLSWGNYSAMIDLIERIAYRKGFGNLLAEGVKRASEIIGKGSAEFALQIKGLECLSFEKKGFALGYATSTRGADHLRALYNIFPGQHENVAIEIWGTTEFLRKNGTEGQATLVKWHQDLLAVVDSLETCKFNCIMCYGMGPRELAALYSAATGWSMSGKELLKTGERIYNVERMFNVREGTSRKDDIMPERIYEIVPSGPTKGTCLLTREELNQMLDEYYELRGWDKNGIPTEEKKKELKLQ
jgi:aldehyde:ferredoxin oxidoreductase